MKVTCPGCRWSQEVPDDKIPREGAKGTCPKCKTQFEVKREAEIIIEPESIAPPPPQRDTKPCPLCGEEILTIAKKCKHCGSMLEDVYQERHTKENNQSVQSTVPEAPKKSVKSLHSRENQLLGVSPLAVAGDYYGTIRIQIGALWSGPKAEKFTGLKFDESKTKYEPTHLKQVVHLLYSGENTSLRLHGVELTDGKKIVFVQRCQPFVDKALECMLLYSKSKGIYKENLSADAASLFCDDQIMSDEEIDNLDTAWKNRNQSNKDLGTRMLDAQAEYQAKHITDINPVLICPHCQVKGKVATKMVARSFFGGGTTHSNTETKAHCHNCHSLWDF